MSFNPIIRWLNHRTLRTKITAGAVLFVLMTAVISVLNVSSVHEAIKKEKSLKTRQLVEVAHTLIQHHFDQYVAGTISETDAQQAALSAIGNLRYSGTNYFWIHDLGTPYPRMVLHATIPELAGQTLDDPVFNCATSEQLGLSGEIQATDGRKNLFLAFNDVVRQAGHGYVTYDWPKPLPDGRVTSERFTKLSYVHLFEPWDWVVGSGIYMDDVENALLRQVGLNLLAWAILLMTGTAFVFLTHHALTPLAHAAKELNAILQGKTVLHPLTVEHPDEVGTLVDSFNQLQNQLAEESRALQENRALLMQAQMMAKVGHLIMDVNTLQWTTSECLDDILGIAPNHPRDLNSLLDLCAPEDRDEVAANLAQVDTQPNWTFNREFRIHRADTGELCWLYGRGRLEYGRDDRLLLVLQDITRRKHNEAAQSLAASVFANTREGIIITDINANIIDVNQAFCSITGYRRDEVVGQNPRILQSGQQNRDFYESMWQSLNSHDHWSGEIWNRRKSGEVFAELMNISAVRDKQGNLRHYVGIFSDITLMKAHQYKLEHLAHYDPLTGVPNRALLEDRMAQALASTRRQGNLMAVCYLDLDGFKPVNDLHGHKAGDALLIEMAQRMNQCIRAGDTVARIGGDEFVILLLGINEPNECQCAVQRILDDIAAPFWIDQHKVQVSASIGVTLFPTDAGNSESLLRHADQAMYIAKQSGKNQFHLFDPNIQAAEIAD